MILKFNGVLTVIFLLICTASRLSAAEFDFSKAVRIGHGPQTVVEFTDPDCPHCRKASMYLDGRRDVTRYVFFYPLARHKRAKEKVRYVLSAPDRSKAYHEVMAGRLDAAAELPYSPEGQALQEAHLDTAKKHAVQSTPTFLINGRIIIGFDLKKIEEALGSGK